MLEALVVFGVLAAVVLGCLLIVAVNWVTLMLAGAAPDRIWQHGGHQRRLRGRKVPRRFTERPPRTGLDAKFLISPPSGEQLAATHASTQPRTRSALASSVRPVLPM